MFYYLLLHVDYEIIADDDHHILPFFSSFYLFFVFYTLSTFSARFSFSVTDIYLFVVEDELVAFVSNDELAFFFFLFSFHWNH